MLDVLYISAFSILLPIVFGAVFFKQLTPALKVLFAFILICGAFEAWSITLFSLSLNNAFLFHLLTLFQFVLLSAVFYLMCPIKLYKSMVAVVSASFSIYLIVNLFITDLMVFDPTMKITVTIILLIYASIYLILALTRFSAPYLELNPYFILVSGLFLYFLGTLSVFLFSFQLNDNSEEFLPAWTIHNLLNIFINLIYTSVIWRSSRV